MEILNLSAADRLVLYVIMLHESSNPSQYHCKMLHRKRKVNENGFCFMLRHLFGLEDIYSTIFKEFPELSNHREELSESMYGKKHWLVRRYILKQCIEKISNQLDK